MLYPIVNASGCLRLLEPGTICTSTSWESQQNSTSAGARPGSTGSGALQAQVPEIRKFQEILGNQVPEIRLQGAGCRFDGRSRKPCSASGRLPQAGSTDPRLWEREPGTVANFPTPEVRRAFTASAFSRMLRN